MAPIAQRPPSPPQYNPVFFLDGERGVGKSTILKSLQEATKNPLDFGFESDKDSSDQGLLGATLDLQHRLIWLDTLDFDTQPRSANLLVAVLSRLSKYFDPFRTQNGQEPDRSQPSFCRLQGSNRLAEFYTNLENTMHRLAFAWEGNLEERSSRLDMEVYAYETSRLERHRLSFQKDWADILQEASEIAQLHDPILNSPLFVLPVDDFDLNPNRGLRFLRHFNNLLSPHLIVLLLGDNDMLPVVMGLPLIKEFRASAGNNILLKQFSAIEVAGQVAASAVRKLIAPGQTIHVDLPRFIDIVSFSTTKREGEDRIRQLLEQIPLDCNTAWIDKNINYIGNKPVNDMFSFLCVDVNEDGHHLLPRYQGQYSLYMPLRHLADFHNEISRLLKKPKKEWKCYFYRFVAEEIKRTVTEQLGMTHYVSHIIEEIIVGSPNGRFHFNPDRIKAKALKVPGVRLAGAGNCTLHAQQAEGWRIQADVSKTDDENKNKKYHTIKFHPAGWLALFHDLMVLRSNPWEENDLRLYDAYFVHSSWTNDTGETHEVPWPLPRWRSFWEIDLFGRTWNQAWRLIRGGVLPKTGEELGDLPRSELMLYRWISCIAFMMQDSKTGADKLEKRLKDNSKLTTDRWKELASVVSSFNSSGVRIERRELIRSARYAIAACLSPVSGAPRDIWRFFEDQYYDMDLEDYHGQELTAFNRKHLQKINELGFNLTTPPILTQRLAKEFLGRTE